MGYGRWIEWGGIGLNIEVKKVCVWIWDIGKMYLLKDRSEIEDILTER
jgi:hypothetical protein